MIIILFINYMKLLMQIELLGGNERFKLAQTFF